MSNENRQLLKLQISKFKNTFMNRTDYILVSAFPILSNKRVRMPKRVGGSEANVHEETQKQC